MLPAFCLIAALPAPALAGGGAHVVDDDAVLDPGVCHSENWVTRTGAGRGLVTVAPACTLAALPRLEIAAAVQHSWDDGTATSLTPAFKLNLRSADEHPVGVAVSAAAVWNLDTNRIEEVQLNVPVTVKPVRGLALHANAGWIITQGSDEAHSLFWGAQAEYELVPNLTLMGEVFGRDDGRVGATTGLRWVTDQGRIDVDLLAGRQIDQGRAMAMTLGVTIRR